MHNDLFYCFIQIIHSPWSRSKCFSRILLLFLWSNGCWQLISGSSAPTQTSGSSQFTCCWSPAWRILSITLLACEISFVYIISSILSMPPQRWILHLPSFRMRKWAQRSSCDMSVWFQIQPASIPIRPRVTKWKRKEKWSDPALKKIFFNMN